MYLCNPNRGFSSAGSERLLDRQEVSSSNLLSLTTKNKALAVSAGALFFYFTTSLVFVVFPIAGFAGLHEIVLDFWLFVTPGLFVVLGIAGDQAIGPVALFVKLEVLVGDGAFRTETNRMLLTVTAEGIEWTKTNAARSAIRKCMKLVFPDAASNH